MTTWNYRVIEFMTDDGHPWQAIHEVFYRDGKPDAYSKTPAFVVSYEGDGESGMADCLDRMREALDKPVLRAADFWAPEDRPITQAEIDAGIMVKVNRLRKGGE